MALSIRMWFPYGKITIILNQMKDVQNAGKE